MVRYPSPRLRLMEGVLSLLLPLACTTVWGFDAAEWKQRTVYQIITDRFALTSGSKDTCGSGNCLYGNYCGGSFAGIVEQLDCKRGCAAVPMMLLAF